MGDYVSSVCFRHCSTLTQSSGIGNLFLFVLMNATFTNRQEHRFSDNVGGVKQFSSTLQHALEEERHFALVENSAVSNHGSLVIVFRSGTRSDPCISSVATAIMITTSNSSIKRS